MGRKIYTGNSLHRSSDAFFTRVIFPRIEITLIFQIAQLPFKGSWFSRKCILEITQNPLETKPRNSHVLLLACIFVFPAQDNILDLYNVKKME